MIAVFAYHSSVVVGLTCFLCCRYEAHYGLPIGRKKSAKKEVSLSKVLAEVVP